ncbi:MAG: hypothetical protein ABIL09_10320 [Gemmatimonadota bacterium]
MPQPLSTCAADCSRCPVEGTPPPAGTYRGGRLAAAAAAFFLGPLALAVGGAVLAGPEQTNQFAGGLAGLAAGLALAAFLARGARPAEEVAR